MKVIAEARVGESTVPPPLPGFVVSSFSPLVADAAERCLVAHPSAGERTAVVLVSGSGDARMAEHVAQLVDGGLRLGPLLFFQAVPNSVAGHVATRWGLRGPVVCLCPTGDPKADGLAQARLLIDDGDADEVLVVLVELTGAGDSAHALLVEGD